MSKDTILKLNQHPKWIPASAAWFHSKWAVPEQAYLESMQESLELDSAIPRWYVMLAEDKIIAGVGVIENDFHDRKDLSPNLCALYVEKNHRGQGLAGEMLTFVCADMQERGIDTLYLITDHVSLYEKYGWAFFCMVQGEGELEQTRMYKYQQTLDVSE